MEVNGVTIPDAGKTTEYIADKVGGWMYVVNTTVTVEQKHINDVSTDLEDAQKELEAAQNKVDKLSAIKDELAVVIPIETPPIDIGGPSATSSPLH